MINSIFKKVFTFIMVALLMIPVSIIDANERLDIDKKASITIKHFDNNKPIPDTMFRIYQVGEISPDKKLTILEPFTKYNISLEDVYEPSKWSEIADTLGTYVQVDNIKPYREGLTKEDGRVSFDNLELGVYLVAGDNSILEQNIIKTKPFLVSSPKKDASTGNITYDVEVATKNDTSTKEDIDFKVEKIWINDEDVPNKPTSIQVELYKDKELYDTITLNEENNWEYIWENLDPKYSWSAIEKEIPKNYTVSYEKYSTSIKIKNTYKEPDGASPGADGVTEQPNEVLLESEVLPQTGSMMIVVQGLALAGLVFLGIGYVIKRRNG